MGIDFVIGVLFDAHGDGNVAGWKGMPLSLMDRVESYSLVEALRPDCAD